MSDVFWVNDPVNLYFIQINLSLQPLGMNLRRVFLALAAVTVLLCTEETAEVATTT